MTPTLSDAVAESVMTFETVAPPFGAVRETVGTTVSAGTKDEPGAGLLPESAQESRLRLQTARITRDTVEFCVIYRESTEQVVCHRRCRKTCE
jgi:hypothetical protein